MALRQTVKHAAMMDANALDGAHGTTSRLLIHACADAGGGSLPALLRRWVARVWGGPHTGAALPTLEIHDLLGRRLLTLTNGGALIDVVLPTGTYHVTEQTGENRRSYTVVLAQNATIDLYLQPRQTGQMQHATARHT